MAKKHRDNGFEIVYFDGAPEHPPETLPTRLRSIVPANLAERVKLYISGHGGTGHDFITDDTQVQRQTVDQLASLLKKVLDHRATVPEQCARTQINMVSCLFARSPDSAAHTSPAAKLHRKLLDNHIYVDLVGRTEAITSLLQGRATISEYDRRITLLSYEKHPTFYRAKVSYTKVLHTVRNGAQVIMRRNYDNDDDPYIDNASPEGKQLLWAERAVDRIFEFVKLDGEGNAADVRHAKLIQIAKLYCDKPRPGILRADLAKLLDPKNANEDENFLLHRDTMTKMFGTVFKPGWLPKSAVLVRSLLDAFPGRA